MRGRRFFSARHRLYVTCIRSHTSGLVSTHAASHWQHYKLTGTPFPAALNTPAVAPPAWLEKSEVSRPGVRSVADAYLTFRLFDLLREPFIRGQGYAEHRTSFWSQLYAGAQFSRFEAWPPSWRTTRPTVLRLGRCALLLGLLPLGMLVVGMIDDVVSLWIGLRRRGVTYLAEDLRWPITALAFGMIALVMKYSYDQRDFSTMKAIFVFPALAAFMVVLARGTQRCLSICGRVPFARAFACGAWVLLVGVYVADIAMLIGDSRAVSTVSAP